MFPLLGVQISELVVDHLRDAGQLSGVLAECLGTELDLDAVSAYGGGD